MIGVDIISTFFTSQATNRQLRTVDTGLQISFLAFIERLPDVSRGVVFRLYYNRGRGLWRSNLYLLLMLIVSRKSTGLNLKMMIMWFRPTRLLMFIGSLPVLCWLRSRVFFIRNKFQQMYQDEWKTWTSVRR